MAHLPSLSPLRAQREPPSRASTSSLRGKSEAVSGSSARYSPAQGESYGLQRMVNKETGEFRTVALGHGRRKVVCSAEVEPDEFDVYYDQRRGSRTGTLRSTVCMDQHVLARMQEDLQRAYKRMENPESGMPDRGALFTEEIFRALNDNESGKTSVGPAVVASGNAESVSPSRLLARQTRLGSRVQGNSHSTSDYNTSAGRAVRDLSVSRKLQNGSTPAAAESDDFARAQMRMSQQSPVRRSSFYDQVLASAPQRKIYHLPVLEDDTDQFIRQERDKKLRAAV